MKSFSRLMFIMLLAIMLIPNISSAQRRKSKKEQNAAIASEQSQRSYSQASDYLIMIRAIERELGIYEIKIDGGFDKEGNKRRVARNAKEEEIINRIIESRSLVNALSAFTKRGYEIKSSYAVSVKGEINHYYLLGTVSYKDTDDTRDRERVTNQRRQNQNRAKLSPEEIEQRKKAREAARER